MATPELRAGQTLGANEASQPNESTEDGQPLRAHAARGVTRFAGRILDAEPRVASDTDFDNLDIDWRRFCRFGFLGPYAQIGWDGLCHFIERHVPHGHSTGEG